MDSILEEVINSCGHVARYRLSFSEYGLDIQSETEDDCDTCKEENTDFRRQIQLRIAMRFGL